MKQKKRNASIVLFLLLPVWGLMAQSTTNSVGFTASGSNGNACISIGQVYYHAYFSTNHSMAEGVQQAYEISTLTASEITGNFGNNLLVYPNPANHTLILKSGDFLVLNMQYYLYDAHGNLLKTEKISDAQTTIDMQKMIPATYFLRVFQGNTIIKTFKIIKN
jgi:hypothetical protein